MARIYISNFSSFGASVTDIESTDWRVIDTFDNTLVFESLDNQLYKDSISATLIKNGVQVMATTSFRAQARIKKKGVYGPWVEASCLN